MPSGDELFAIIERHGIIGPQGLLKLESLSVKQLSKLYDEIFHAIYQAQLQRVEEADASELPDPFSFQASASIRGDSGCSSVECRGNKISFLARYGALYANELIFPLSLRSPQRVSHKFELRDLLGQNLFSLFLLRPLITGGVVLPVVMRTQHCIHHAEMAERATAIVHDFSQFTARHLLNEFRLTYEIPEKSPSGQPTLYLEGPEEYIEHGGLARRLDETPKWLPRTLRFNQKGQAEVRGEHKRHMVIELFTEMADNVAFYLAYGTRRNARFLSDMAGETEFLEWLTDDERMTAKSLALRELEHSVPVLADLSIATILRIRKEERDSFESYRSAVGKISADIMAAKNRVSKKEAREMFRTAIEPELQKMKREIVTYRKTQHRRVLAGVASVIAGVGIGAYTGLPPLISVPLVATASLVGGRLLSKAAESACEHGPETEQKNDLYFLLRLTQEAGA
jgi:hypothetical protein